MKLIAAIVLLIGSFTLAQAQLVVEDDIKTDSVNVFATAEPARYSAGIAIAATVLLPGLGHQYIGDEQRTLSYIAAEALAWFGFFYCESYALRLEGDAHAFANTWAGAQGGAKADELYWLDVGRLMDSEGQDPYPLGHEQIQSLNRTTQDRYIADNLQWHWQSNDLRKEYQQQIQNTVNFHVAANFFIGAMVLNRIIAFMDIRMSTRDKTIKTTKPSIVSTIKPYAIATPTNTALGFTAQF